MREEEEENNREEEEEKRREEVEVWGGELCDVIWRWGRDPLTPVLLCHLQQTAISQNTTSQECIQWSQYRNTHNHLQATDTHSYPALLMTISGEEEGNDYVLNVKFYS